ncbi:hypothetical protein [Enhygromyxa salina]|uniref:Uncharacterized protein n=1 Tax=Enhygromyxa salina TaxID=215803 RepID=A0A2S9YKQ7_9BACT|nr:hypothetical protein [Enhygromyxa salina]PRQ05648.1 hypothetical protein ENSA7_45380 [Enhygromyxa salina]
MAGADERLTPATRNYVIFGLLLVVALALAARDRFGPHRGRGESDTALRLMVVGGSVAVTSALDEVDGFSIMRIGPAEAIALGSELVDDDAPAYQKVIAYADQHGYGFLALALSNRDDQPSGAQWELDVDDPGIDALPPATAHFVVFSVGDLAPQGPRMRVVELAALDYEGSGAQLESLRLALYDHPDLQALWQHDGQGPQLQARQVLTNRGLPERRQAFAADQARWRELAQLWPAPGVIAGSLAGAWEQVRAAPIRGGVLIEARAARPTVSVFRRPSLELSRSVSLWFVPVAALSDDDPDESGARTRCHGLPATLSAQSSEISVAPDGASLVLRETPTSAAQLFVFDEQAALEGHCLAQVRATLPAGERAIGRPNAAGRMAWHYDDDWLHWFAPNSQQREQVNEIAAFSGPWWVDDTLLAMISSRPIGAPEHGFEPVVTLLDTDARKLDADGRFARVELDASALFPALAPGSEAAALIDLRPSSDRELLVLTERCESQPSQPSHHGRPCLHRLRSVDPLATLASLIGPDVLASPDEPADAEPPFTVETLGPFGPYTALAIAAKAGRAVWIDGEAHLMIADLRGAAPLEPRRLDADDLADSTPRISADGRVIVSEVSVSLDELGSVSIARAFVQPAPPPAAPAPAPDPAPQPR